MFGVNSTDNVPALSTLRGLLAKLQSWSYADADEDVEADLVGVGKAEGAIAVDHLEVGDA